MILNKYPFINQLGTTDCGAACVAMIIKRFTNVLIPLGEISHLIYCNENGSSFLGIKKGLENIGIGGEVFKCEKSINEFEKMSFPVLTQTAKDNKYHFVIIYKMNHNHLLIADPLEKKKNGLV